MGMPSCRAALAEVNDAAVVVRGVSRLDDRLARPGNRPGPSFDRLGAFHRDVRYLFKRDHLHDDSLLKLTARKGYPRSDGYASSITAGWKGSRGRLRRR